MTFLRNGKIVVFPPVAGEERLRQRRGRASKYSVIFQRTCCQLWMGMHRYDDGLSTPAKPLARRRRVNRNFPASGNRVPDS